MSRAAREGVASEYKQRYQAPRDQNIHPPADLPYFLDVVKHTRPDLFREELRMTPYTFDSLVERLQDDPVFDNDSPNEQMSPEHQIAIACVRFGYHGNAAKVKRVAYWAGCSVGAVLNATRRVMKALLRREFMDETMAWPTEEEKELAKQWIEDHSIKKWRGGWCFTDGMLGILYARPFWYGPSYYDRKHTYSLNLQVCGLIYRDCIALTCSIDYLYAQFTYHRLRVWLHRIHSRLHRLDKDKTLSTPRRAIRGRGMGVG